MTDTQSSVIPTCNHESILKMTIGELIGELVNRNNPSFTSISSAPNPKRLGPIVIARYVSESGYELKSMAIMCSKLETWSGQVSPFSSYIILIDHVAL